MWARRAGLVLRCFKKSPFSGAQAADSAASSHVQASAGSSLGQWGSQQARQYTGGNFWEVPHPSGLSRHDLCLELSTARNMLPHRGNFTPQFTPHGVQLMPHRQSMHMQEAMLASDPFEGQEVPVMADSVKRKRRMKIKKHKFKKRMKKLRHQT